jgi:hypothetical protein
MNRIINHISEALMRLTENKIKKLIRSALKDHLANPTNEAFQFVAAYEAGSALLGLVAPYLISLGAEQGVRYGRSVNEKKSYKALEQYFDFQKVDEVITKLKDLIGYNEACGGPSSLKYQLENFYNDCNFIAKEFKRVLDIDFKFVMDNVEATLGTLDVGVAGALSKSFYNERKPRMHKGRIVDPRGGIPYKSAADIGGKSLKILSYAGTIYTAYQIADILSKDQNELDMILEILNQKDFNGKIKIFEQLHEDMLNNKLPCKLTDTDISGLPQSFDEE